MPSFDQFFISTQEESKHDKKLREKIERELYEERIRNIGLDEEFHMFND